MTAPQQYLRRCNGQPAAGIPVDRRTAEFWATRPGVKGTLDTGLTWTVRDQTGTRKFTITPCDTQQH